VREQLLLDAGDEHDRELEALGGVERHQGRPLGAGVHRVDVADERDVLQEAAQAAGLLRIVRLGPGALPRRDEAVVLRGVGDQLLDVRLAVDAALVVHLRDPGVVVDLRDQLAERDGRGRVGERREAVHELREALEAAAGAAADRRQRLFRAEGGEDRDAARGGPLDDEVDALVPDAALRSVHGAAEGDLVGRVHRELQVGEEVADLAARVELEAADDLVRDALEAQGALDRALHEVHAVEDRELARRAPGGDAGADLERDLARLVVLVRAADRRDARAGIGGGPDRLLLARAVPLDDRLGRREDVARRAVVLLEADDFRRAEVALEVEDVADVRAAPGVDRLVGVAADGQVAVEGREVLRQEVLDAVRVLVLVDEDVAEAARVRVADAGVALEELEDADQEVVEVERVALAHRGLVQPAHVDEDLVLDSFGPLGIRGCLGLRAAVPLVLRGADPRADHRGLEAGRVVVRGLDQLLQELVAVARVVDREVARPPPRGPGERGDVPPQDARAHRVEGADPGPADLKERLDALAHLRGGLVREGDREDLGGPDAALEDQPGDPARDHARLARPRPGQDQERPLAVRDGLALGRVQAVEEAGGRLGQGRRLAHEGRAF
jgi:hypothetical protein